MKMKTLLRALPVLALVIVATSCGTAFDNLNCVRGTGDVLTETRNITESFSSVNAAFSGDVYITLDPEADQSVVVNGQEKVLEQLDIWVSSDGVLNIEFRRCVNRFKQLEVELVMNDVADLNLAGSGSINTRNTIMVDDLDLEVLGSGDINVTAEVEDLWVNVAGSGDVTYDGTAATAKMSIAGSGSIRTNSSLTVNEADLNILGSGNLVATIVDGVTAEIKGSGDMFLDGTATSADFYIGGSGEIEALDLATTRCEVRIDASGDVKVSVSDELDVRITGSGNVRYAGDPTVFANVLGSGNIIKVN